MKATTEKGFREKIRKAADQCGTYKPEFEEIVGRLAWVYLRIQQTRAEYVKSGASVLIKHTNKAGATNYVKNPLLIEIDNLMKMALEMEKELGLTASALKKINEAAMPGKAAADDDPLAAALGRLHVL